MFFLQDGLQLRQMSELLTGIWLIYYNVTWLLMWWQSLLLLLLQEKQDKPGMFSLLLNWIITCWCNSICLETKQLKIKFLNITSNTSKRFVPPSCAWVLGDEFRTRCGLRTRRNNPEAKTKKTLLTSSANMNLSSYWPPLTEQLKMSPLSGMFVFSTNHIPSMRFSCSVCQMMVTFNIALNSEADQASSFGYLK